MNDDPTTPEGAAYWQERHDYEARVEDGGHELPYVPLVSCEVCNDEGCAHCPPDQGDVES